MSTSDSAPLLAYMIHDGDDEWDTVFATSNAAARRIAEKRFDGYVAQCKRAPGFDQYAPGPVPIKVMIADGWQFECAECSRWVYDGMIEDDPDDVEPMTYEPTYLGRYVYCSPACRAYDVRERRERASYEAAACELLEARYPGALLEHVERADHENRVPMKLTFTFPGSKWSVTWTSGEATALVHPDDVEAFVSLYRKSKQ